jgi:hypothetical protein
MIFDFKVYKKTGLPSGTGKPVFNAIKKGLPFVNSKPLC